MKAMGLLDHHPFQSFEEPNPIVTSGILYQLQSVLLLFAETIQLHVQQLLCPSTLNRVVFHPAQLLHASLQFIPGSDECFCALSIDSMLSFILSCTTPCPAMER